MFDMPTDKKKIQNKSACETNGNDRWEPKLIYLVI